MKKANNPSGDDFQKALEALFPKYIESDGFTTYPPKAYMLHGYKLMGGGFMVQYASFLAEDTETLFSASDDDAIDCIKYLAHQVYRMVGIQECSEERYKELCRAGKEELQETVG